MGCGLIPQGLRWGELRIARIWYLDFHVPLLVCHLGNCRSVELIIKMGFSHITRESTHGRSPIEGKCWDELGWDGGVLSLDHSYLLYHAPVQASDGIVIKVCGNSTSKTVAFLSQLHEAVDTQVSRVQPMESPVDAV